MKLNESSFVRRSNQGGRGKGKAERAVQMKTYRTYWSEIRKGRDCLKT